MIQLIAIDLDGTLCMKISRFLKAHRSFHKAHEAGYDIVICNGRPLAGSVLFLKRLAFRMATTIWLSITAGTTLSTKNWGNIGKEELSLEDMHRLHVLTKDSDVQLTLFDMDHY